MAPLASSTSSSAATPDPYVDLFSSAPRVGPIAAAGALIPVLPLLRTSPFHDEPPLLCAAYKASCVGYSLPPRGTLSLASGAGGLGIGMYRRCERPLETTPKGLLQGPAAGAGAFTRPQGSPAQGRAEAGGLLLPDQLTRAALQLGPSRLRSPAAGRRTSQGAQAQIGHALCAGPFLGHLPVHAKGAC